MKKNILAVLMAATMVMGTSMTSFAAGWQQNSTGWWYGTNADNSAWYSNDWQWIDGNNDGVAECYYFDGNGYLLSNTTTPDSYEVNADGAWIVNGVVQTQTTAQQSSQGGTSAVTGFNSDGISNIAIDLINSTRDEANAKYGPEKAYESGTGKSIFYPNIPYNVMWSLRAGHEAAWEQDPSNMDNYFQEVVSDKPSQMVNFLTAADDNKTPLELIKLLKSKGYDARGNDAYCYVNLDGYQIQFYFNNIVRLMKARN